MRDGAMVCSSRASIISVAVATYFFGTISATATAVKMVASENQQERLAACAQRWHELAEVHGSYLPKKGLL